MPDYLGEFEQLVLMALTRLGGTVALREAHGAFVRMAAGLASLRR
jgi:hypothetical protein